MKLKQVVLILGKLHDKSTPPTINVNAGNIIKIPSDIKNLGYCLPSSSCFFFANLLKKKIIIKAIIKDIKKTSKLFQHWCRRIKSFNCHKGRANNNGASSGIGNALNAAKYQKNICNNKGIFLKNSI